MNKEYDFVKRLTQFSPRSDQQINSFFTSDAEILQTENGFLCASVDTISEEISFGLIHSPQTLGWLAAIVSISDLAAIGEKSTHLSISFLKSSSVTEKFEKDFKSGVDKACAHFQCHLEEYQVLTGTQTVITSTAFCVVKKRPQLFRTPINPGDLLYLTGPLGLGNAVAFANVAIRKQNLEYANQIDESYQPLARVKEGIFLKSFAKACLDTSDGGLFSLDLFASLNQVGIEIDYCEKIFHPLALTLARAAKVNPFIFFAAQNGEFELLSAISPEKEEFFLKDAQQNGLKFLKIGAVINDPGLFINHGGRKSTIDMTSIQNLLHDGVPPDQYILALLKFAASNKIEAF